jgi:outer membrane lipoprotein-sorting protein
MKRPVTILGLILTFAVAVRCPAQKLDGAAILRNVERTTEGVRDYVVDLQAEVNMERLRIPRMKATMYFKKPDKVHFDAPGFAMLPREGLALDAGRLREKFDATVMGIDTIDGKPAQKLQLAAKDSKTALRQLFVWVDTQQWTVKKFETIPYEGRTLTVTFHYALQQGLHWLPDTMKATFGFAGVDTAGSSIMSQYAPQINELQRPPRTGSMKVVYSNYRVNEGVSDEVFERKEKK